MRINLRRWNRAFACSGVITAPESPPPALEERPPPAPPRPELVPARTLCPLPPAASPRSLRPNPPGVLDDDIDDEAEEAEDEEEEEDEDEAEEGVLIDAPFGRTLDGRSWPNVLRPATLGRWGAGRESRPDME